MPVKHLRVCPTPCNRIRYAACGNACRVPADTDPENWRINLQAGAGTIGRMPIPDGIYARYDNTGDLVETGTVRDGVHHRHPQPVAQPGVPTRLRGPA